MSTQVSYIWRVLYCLFQPAFKAALAIHALSDTSQNKKKFGTFLTLGQLFRKNKVLAD
jgi:hypothetical protein